MRQEDGCSITPDSVLPTISELLIEATGEAAAFGQEGKPFFWIEERPPAARGGLHIAFAVEERPTVNAFHAAGLDAGGTDNGAPGLRTIYHPDYYGACILDPDGNNIEAVCRKPA